MLCPCNSSLNYDECCGIYIEQGRNAPTPEALMRSRYTAYSLAKIDYVVRTMRGKPLLGFDPKEIEQTAKATSWISLQVLRAYNENEDKGYVEFIAKIMENRRLKKIHELSEFHREEGVWYYVNGKNPERPVARSPARNSPCPCGSQKKFKNCHGNP